MAGINGNENECKYDKNYIVDLEKIPNAFNIGQCDLKIDDQWCPVQKDLHLFPDAWHFVEKNFIQTNLNPVDAMIPRTWKLNLMTRAYVELKQFQKAQALNEEALTMSGSCNIAALANSVILLRCFGRMKEASDKANELKEKQQNMTPEFKEQMIDAFSEQAYYNYMLGNNTGTAILDFVAHLRASALKDHEKYLLFRMYRRLACAKNIENDKAELLKIVQLLHDIESGDNNMLKALTYIEMERIMSDRSFDIQEFQTKENRSKDEFIELARQLGNTSALILHLIGIQKMKSGESEMAKNFFNGSFDVEPSERTCYYLGFLYLHDAQSLTMDEEKKLVQIPKEFNPHGTDQLRQYLLRYRDFIDWTQDHQVEEELLKALGFFEQRNKLLAMKTMRSMFNLALLYMRCKKYSEAIAFIDSHVLSGQSLHKNALIEIQAYVLKAVAVEAEHTGPGISTESKVCLEAAVKKSCLKIDDENVTMSDDILLNNIQKIPSFKLVRSQKSSRKSDDDKIRHFLSNFGPNTESDKKRKFKPEFLEINCIRSASFLIENNNYSQAINECRTIISDDIPNNIFSKVQALILKAKALEKPLSDRQILKEESLESLVEAFNLVYPNDEGHKPSKNKLYKGLIAISSQFSYFFVTAF